MAVVTSAKFREYRCFREQWSGFDAIKPINVIIGRNNVGKSHLLDLVEAMCQTELKAGQWCLRCETVLEEESLKRVFSPSRGGGELHANHWDNHGRLFAGKATVLEQDTQGRVSFTFPDGSDIHMHPHNQAPYDDRIAEVRASWMAQSLKPLTHKLSGSAFRRLLADRDVRPERASTGLSLSPSGVGATNIIRRFTNSANPAYPREIIQKDVLDALNLIFQSDGRFTEIDAREHDEGTQGEQGTWEVFLGEAGKADLIPLSSSGSGLKTVLLVLLNLLVIPHISAQPSSGSVFAMEELENNLHPALLRRLLRYLEDYALREKATVFLTTHSSVALDLFGVSGNAQIVHVTHDGKTARATTVAAHFEHLGVISELGAKPSDLLQANGILWVEGPSDRIYLNHWVRIFSGGALREGRDYQCAFYGGALLARCQFAAPKEADDELANLLRLNSNIVVVCDGDRTAASGDGSQFKERVERIKAEVERIPKAHIWITEAKEIENYLPGSVLGRVFELQDVPDPGQYDRFFPAQSDTCFIEAHLHRRSLDKMELAAQALPHMTKEAMAPRFELANQMAAIIERIRAWNV